MKGPCHPRRWKSVIKYGEICVAPRQFTTDRSASQTWLDSQTQPMPELLVIADDLTGASDAGVQFARKGISVLVFTNVTCESTTLTTAHHVIVVNTESRHLQAEEA